MKIQGFFSLGFTSVYVRILLVKPGNLKQLDKDALIPSYTKALTLTAWYV